MGTNFPGALDTLTNPTGGSNLNTAGVVHADEHANANDAIEALEAKVGVDFSAVVGSLDQRVNRFVYIDTADSSTTASAKILAAQSSGKPVILAPGTHTWAAGVVTSQSFVQPNIYGPGYKVCTINVTNGDPAITFTGGSGQQNGGSINDVSITGSSATGVRCLGANGIGINRVRFASIARGVHFSNNAASAFTEFCVANDCVFESTCVVPIEYEKGSGTQSFHASGFDGNTVIVQPSGATTPLIKVGAGCLVYDAPWNGTIFFAAASPAVLVSSSLVPTVHGTIRVEMQGGFSASFVSTSSSAPVYLAGHILTLTETVTFYPWLRLVYRAQYNADSSVTADFKPWNRKVTLASTAVVLVNQLQPGKSALVRVTIAAANYEYHHLLYFYTTPGTGASIQATLLLAENLDTIGAGAPVFAIDGSQNLKVTNANYTGSFLAWVGVEEGGTWPTHPIL